MSDSAEIVSVAVAELNELLIDVNSDKIGFEHEFVSVLDRLVDEIKSQEIDAIKPHLDQIISIIVGLISFHPKWHMRMVCCVAACHLIRDYGDVRPDIIYGLSSVRPATAAELGQQSLVGAIWSIRGHEKPEVRETAAQAIAAVATSAPAIFDSAFKGELCDLLRGGPGAWEPRETAGYCLGNVVVTRPDIAPEVTQALIAGTKVHQPLFFSSMIRQRAVEGLRRLAGAQEVAPEALSELVDVGFTLAADEGIESRRAAAALVARAAVAQGPAAAAAAAQRAAEMLELPAQKWEPRFFAALCMRELVPWLVSSDNTAAAASAAASLRAALAVPVPVMPGQSPSQAHSETLVTFAHLLVIAPEDTAPLPELLDWISEYIQTADPFKIDGAVAALGALLAVPVVRAALPELLSGETGAKIWTRLAFTACHPSLPIANAAECVRDVLARVLAPEVAPEVATDTLHMHNIASIYATAASVATNCTAADLRQGVFTFLHRLLEQPAVVAKTGVGAVGEGFDARSLAKLLLNHGVLSELGMPVAEDARIAASRATVAWVAAAPHLATQEFVTQPLIEACSLVGTMQDSADNLAAAALTLVARVIVPSAPSMPQELLLRAAAAATVAAGSYLPTIRAAAAAVAPQLLAPIIRAEKPLTLLASRLPCLAPAFPFNADNELVDDMGASRSAAVGLLTVLASVGDLSATFTSEDNEDKEAAEHVLKLVVYLLCNDAACWEPVGRSAGLALAARLCVGTDGQATAAAAALVSTAETLAEAGVIEEGSLLNAVAGAVAGEDGPGCAGDAEELAEAAEAAAAALADELPLLSECVDGTTQISDYERPAVIATGIALAHALFGAAPAAAAAAAEAVHCRFVEYTIGDAAPACHAVDSLYDAPVATLLGRFPLTHPLALLAPAAPACRWVAAAAAAATAPATAAGRLALALAAGKPSETVVEDARAVLASAGEAEAENAREIDGALRLLGRLGADELELLADDLDAQLKLIEDKAFRFDFQARAISLALAVPAYSPLVSARARQAVADTLLDSRLAEDLKLDVIADHVALCAHLPPAPLLPPETPVDLARDNTAFAKAHVALQQVK